MAAAAVWFFAAGCEKEDTGMFVEQAEIVSAGLKTDMESMHIFSLLHKAVHDTALARRDTAVIDSAMVISYFDSTTNIRHFSFDYGTGIVGPDWKTRSGKVTATLGDDFSEPDAVIAAQFENYRVDGFMVAGEMSYTNTGDFISGSKMMSFTADISSTNDQDYSTIFETTREIYWTEGFDDTDNYSTHEFLFTGEAQINYSAIGTSRIGNASISASINTPWEVRLQCSKLIKSGASNYNIAYETGDEEITGTFIDSDLDNCSDKVMLKNSENFGYPFYL